MTTKHEQAHLESRATELRDRELDAPVRAAPANSILDGFIHSRATNLRNEEKERLTMIVSKVYVIAMGATAGSQPIQEVADLCARMRARGLSWGLMTDDLAADTLELFAIATSKHALAGGLPAAFQVRWEQMSIHAVNPLNPTQWFSPLRASLMLPVVDTATNTVQSHVFVCFPQPSWPADAYADAWVEAPVQP